MVLDQLQKGYTYLFHDIADQRTRGYVTYSPFPWIFLLIFYNFFVLKLGPYLMRNRSPYNIKKLILVYNVIQILCCLTMWWKATKVVIREGLHYAICVPAFKEDNELTREVILFVYSYFFLKILDLLDTVFFVLRKQYNRATFLHLYHHTGMVVLIWGGLEWLPCSQDIFIGYINLPVHVFMYSYYSLALIDSQRFQWLKKYVTQLQMFQFFINIIHSLLPLFITCDSPKYAILVLVPQNCFMLFLFWDFYKMEFVNKKKTSKTEIKQE